MPETHPTTASNPEQSRGKGAEPTTEQAMRGVWAKYPSAKCVEFLDFNGRWFGIIDGARTRNAELSDLQGDQNDAWLDAWQRLQGAEAKAETPESGYATTTCQNCGFGFYAHYREDDTPDILRCLPRKGGKHRGKLYLPAPIASVGEDETDEAWVKAHAYPEAHCVEKGLFAIYAGAVGRRVISTWEKSSDAAWADARRRLESVSTAAHNEYPEATALPTDERFSFYFDAEGDFVIEAHRQNAGQHLSAHGETPNEAVKAMCRFIEMLPEGRRLESAPTAAEPVEKLSGLALDMAVVRVKWQDARRVLVAGEWLVLPRKLSTWGDFIGRAATESEAWADAAEKVIEGEYDIEFGDVSKGWYWTHRATNRSMRGTTSREDLALESAKRDYITRHAADAKNAAEPVLGESEDCVCGHPVLTHHFTGCRLCGCSRYRIPANDLKTLQSMQAKYAAMMERMHDALHGLVYFSESVEVRMDKARSVLAAYREMGLDK